VGDGFKQSESQRHEMPKATWNDSQISLKLEILERESVLEQIVDAHLGRSSLSKPGIF